MCGWGVWNGEQDRADVPSGFVSRAGHSAMFGKDRISRAVEDNMTPTAIQTRPGPPGAGGIIVRSGYLWRLHARAAFVVNT